MTKERERKVPWFQFNIDEHNDQVIRTMMHDEVDILLSVGKLSQNMI